MQKQDAVGNGKSFILIVGHINSRDPRSMKNARSSASNSSRKARSNAPAVHRTSAGAA